MGDFAKRLDPTDILSAAFVVGATVLGGPVGGLAAASGVLGASAQVKAAGAQQVELDLAARQEKLAATDREVQRKRRLNAVLGTQAAQAAASGVAFSGSVANVSVSDAEQASVDRLVDRSNTRIVIDSINRRRKSIGRAGALSAATSILSTAGTIAQGVKIEKKKPASGGSARARG